MDFEALKLEGKTVVIKETKTKETPLDYVFWGEKKVGNETIYVWRKIVTFDEAKRIELERIGY